MKHFCIILSFLLLTLSVYSQSNVFVLIDVSQSIKQNELTDAKQALNEVLTGIPLSKAYISQGKQQDLVNFKLSQGDKLALSKLGSLHTTLMISPNPTVIQNVSADVSQVLNSISWIPTDGQTYITLAKAKIAEYAKNQNITEYKLYVVSDNIQDDYGKSGTPNYPDDYTRNLAEGYNTSTNPVSESGYTKLKFTPSSFFTISLSPSVDVSKYVLPGGNSVPPIIDTDSQKAVITITSPPERKKGNEYEMSTQNLSVNWTCSNCPQGIKYNITVSQYEGGKFKQTKNLTASPATFEIPDGKFRISIAASNYVASSDYTCIDNNTGGYGWIIFLAVIAIAGTTGYYFWNKKRRDKIEAFSSNKGQDIFSKGSSGSTGSSSNSEYF